MVTHGIVRDHARNEINLVISCYIPLNHSSEISSISQQQRLSVDVSILLQLITTYTTVCISNTCI